MANELLQAVPKIKARNIQINELFERNEDDYSSLVVNKGKEKDKKDQNS